MTTPRPADRSSLTSGWARFWRAGIVASLTVTISLGSHVVGGGMPPTLAVIALVSLLAAALCWALSRHRWSVRELLATFLFAQSAVHLLSMSPLNGPDDMATMGMGAQMLVSHVVGAVMLVGIVRWGESSLWAIVEVIALRPAKLLRTVTAPAAVATPVVIAFVQRLQPATWPYTAPGRAPPKITVPPVTA